MADAYLAAAKAPDVEGETIDIGSGTMASVQEVVERLVSIIDPPTARPSFGVRPDRPLEQEVEVDVDRAERLLQWRACTGLDEGLRRTVEWVARGQPGETVGS